MFAAAFQITDSEQIIERLFPSSAAVPQVLTAGNDPDGKLQGAERARFLPFYRGANHRRAKYPIISTSLAVSPDRIPEAKRLWGCDFTPDGQAVVTSRQHRLAVLKASGHCEMS